MKVDISFQADDPDGGGKMPDVLDLTFDLGDGAVARIEIVGPDEGSLLPRHLTGLKQLVDRIGGLLCDHIWITTREELS